MFSYQPIIALVHDDFIQAGGAENLFATIAALWPEAPIYTSQVDWQKLPKSVDKSRLRTSFIQKLPFAKKLYKTLFPLYPLAFESFDLRDFDIVISSTTRFAKSILTKPETTHICYINSTPRFLWDKNAKSQYVGRFAAFLLTPVFAWLKRWDKVAASRPDFYIANSQNVAERIKGQYNKEASVVYPFAAIDFFHPPKIHNWDLKSKNYFLVVNRLIKWKRVDLAIKAVAETKDNLIVVGEGPEKNKLENLAGKLDAKVEFVGRTTFESLRDYYQNAKALIVTQEEDFGIATVEAQACGIPAVAYTAGGQKEIIIDGKTGIFFNNQTPTDLKDALIRASKVEWNQATCRKNALRFSKNRFEKELRSECLRFTTISK